nr:ATP-binding protein [Prochloraceae cyanobacterium]
AATEIKELLEVDRVLIIRLLNESATIVEETECINCSSLKGKEIFDILAINDYLPEYRDGKTKIIDDFNLQGKTVDLGIKSALIAPIFTKEKLWGLLVIHQCYEIKEWEKFDIELSKELADRIGIAISLAQLLENLEDMVERRTFKLSQANQQLQEQIKERTLAEKKLRIITDNIPAFIAYVDDRERYLFNNKIYADWFDRPLSQITGQRIRDVLPEENYKKIKPSLDRALAGEKVTIDTQMIRDNGDCSWFNANFIPDLDRDRRVKGFFALIVDITERKAIEEMKNNFLSIVSHELRTPLTSIHGSLKLLATGKLGRLSPEGLQMLSIADVNTDRLVRLVEDILNLKQMESGKVRMEKRSCNSSELIHQAIDLIGPIATENKIILIGNSSNISFWADSDYILQVLTNLIDNGIKFSPPGGTIWITATLHLDGSQILFSVRDKGKGIPQNQLDIIFKSFHQVDASDAREKGGTGLGLAICQTILQLHGGRIWVESVLGRGSTFYFTLPLCKP